MALLAESIRSVIIDGGRVSTVAEALAFANRVAALQDQVDNADLPEDERPSVCAGMERAVELGRSALARTILGSCPGVDATARADAAALQRELAAIGRRYRMAKVVVPSARNTWGKRTVY
ncbi:hypothetical protein [Nocardia stercoris]|uniref:Uncharacterized protein n=1 Tax=Nocardia stercoris TaxID=2483361 RepID=A0A3M2KV28_9NOCA|nr:hypothetical protein [Nocardia stercoris]RMI29487.1 hypothetical protein EBN03_25755 [Nocardia stercoris]